MKNKPPRPVKIKLKGDTYFVTYQDRKKHGYHCAAQFNNKYSNEGDVINWVKEQKNLYLIENE